MPTEVVTIRLSKEDVKYIEKSAAQLGVKKAPFLQNLLKTQLAILRKEPIPEKIQKQPTKNKQPSPKNMTFWGRYTEALQWYTHADPMPISTHLLLKLMESTVEALEAHAKEFEQTLLICTKLKLQILNDAQKVSDAFQDAHAKVGKKVPYPEEVKRMLRRLTDYQRHELLQQYKQGEHPERLLDEMQIAVKP